MLAFQKRIVEFLYKAALTNFVLQCYLSTKCR